MDIRLQSGDARFSLRAAALILQNGQLLVIQNDTARCCYTIGGGVQIGETTEEALLRECREETGLDWQIERLVFVQERFYRAEDIQHHELVFFYLMKPPAVPIPSGQNTDQMDERLCWLPLDKLEDAPLVPAFLKEAMRKLPLTVTHIVAYE